MSPTSEDHAIISSKDPDPPSSPSHDPESCSASTLTHPPSTLPTSKASSTTPPPKPRQSWIDRTKVFLTITVIIHHCIYTLVGGWWPLQPIYPDLLTFQVGLYLLQLNQSYFMGLFFLLSGLFVTPSYNRKRPLRFIIDRFIRLLIPVPIYELLINPFVVLAVAAIQSKTIDPPRILQDYYRIFHPFPNNHLWFIMLLFACDFSYLLLRLLIPPLNRSLLNPPSKPSTTPSRLPTILIITTALSLFLGITTYLTRISFPIGIVYPVVGAVSYLPQYILAYALGITLTHHTILSYLPHRSPHLLLTSLTIVAILSASLGCTTFLSDLSLIYGGTSIPAFLFAVFESGLAVFMWLLMVVLFSGWFNGNNVTGCEKRIVESAYAVYLLHPPVVIIMIALFVVYVKWMHYLGVFGVTSVICVVVSWGIGVMVRAIPRVDVVL